MAYLSCVDQYAKLEELPTGHGIVDVVFLPKRRSFLSAMIVELKWNQSAAGAIQQVLDKNYPTVPEQFGGKIMLVGIDYDKDEKTHASRIAEYIKS